MEHKTPSRRRIFCYVLLCVLALFLTVSSLQTKAEPILQYDQLIPLSELATSDAHLATVVYDEASGTLTLTATSTEQNGSVALPAAYRSMKLLFVESEGYGYDLVSHPDPTKPTEEHLIYGKRIPLADGQHLYFCYDFADPTIRLEVRAGESVTLRSLRAISTDGYEIFPAVQPIALASLAVLALVLFLTEKKFGFYRFLGGLIVHSATFTKETLRTRGAWIFLLHVVSILTSLLFAVMAMLDLMLCIQTPQYSVALLVAAFLAIAGLILDTCIVKKNAKPALLVLAVLLTVGSTMVLTEAPAMRTSWDDGYHFANSSYSPTLVTNGGEIPTSVYLYACEHYDRALFAAEQNEMVGSLLYFGDLPTAAFDMQAGIDSLLHFDWYIYLLAIPALPFLLLYFLFTYVAYSPAIVSFFLGNLVGADFLKLFLLGKLFNVAGYALLVSFAVRKLRSGAYLFSAISLLPVCVFLAATYSCDWWITGAVLVGFAYFFSILQNREAPAKLSELIIMISALAFACGPKEIYCFLMLPLLFLPRDRFASKRAARVTKLVVLALMIVILISFAVPMLVNTGASTDVRGGSDVNGAEQIKFILSDPLGYAKICLDFIKGYVSLPSMSSHLTFFAWLGASNQIYSLIAVLVLFYCTFTDRTADDRYKRAWIQRGVGLLTGFIQIVLVATALYVTYTPVGYWTVNGCQYRYLFPIFPLFLYNFMPLGMVNKTSDRAKCAVVFSLLALVNLAAYYEILLAAII